MAKEAFEIDMPPRSTGEPNDFPSVRFEMGDGDEVISVSVENRGKGFHDWLLITDTEAERLAMALVNFATRIRENS